MYLVYSLGLVDSDLEVTDPSSHCVHCIAGMLINVQDVWICV